MKLFKKNIKENPIDTNSLACSVNVSRNSKNQLNSFFEFLPLERPEHQIYLQMRQLVPIIDAAIGKIIRLMGEFDITCQNPEAQLALDQFLNEIPVSGTGKGIYAFLKAYMDDLLLYGNAVGEIVFTKNQQNIYALYNAPVEKLVVKHSKDGIGVDFYRKDAKGLTPITQKNRLLFSALNPRSGELAGRSLLEGLPFVTNILLKIYGATEKNFDRVGNVRFAVTYNPGNQASEKAYAKERAEMIAEEWAKAMRSDQVRDFVAVGDVDIKVIGADNQTLDTSIPVRQMLEQIVSKLGIPPYLLGLNWSTTERMSTAQADILTSELMSYQRVLTPTILQICRTFLRVNGHLDDPILEWKEINLLDEVEGANARYLRAKAMQIEESLEG